MKFGLREIIFAALLLCIPLGAWWFAFRPANAYNQEVLEQIQQKQDKLRALNEATATMGDMKEEIESLEKAIAFFEDKLPSEKEIDRVLKEVWQLAESNHLKTKSIRTLNRKQNAAFSDPTGPHSEQPIALQLEGDFRGFYAFLQQLENLPRITRVRKMQLQKLKDAPEGHMVAEFEVSIFFERGKDES